MKSPLITIVTITYNAVDVITPTMESVAAQTFTDYEHLIIDGASKDDTIAKANALRTGATRIISEPDKGLYDAMNKGIKNSRGHYLIFLNAGDAFASPDTLALYAQKAREGADIIYGDTVIVDANRNIIKPRHLSAPDILTFDSFSHGMLICHQAFMVKKGIAPLYDTGYRFSADYDWTIKCIARTTPSSCASLNTVTIHYLSDGLTDKNKIPSLRERFDVMRRHYGLLKAISRHLSFIPRAFARRFAK